MVRGSPSDCPCSTGAPEKSVRRKDPRTTRREKPPVDMSNSAYGLPVELVAIILDCRLLPEGTLPVGHESISFLLKDLFAQRRALQGERCGVDRRTGQESDNIIAAHAFERSGDLARL